MAPNPASPTELNSQAEPMREKREAGLSPKWPAVGWEAMVSVTPVRTQHVLELIIRLEMK